VIEKGLAHVPRAQNLNTLNKLKIGKVLLQNTLWHFSPSHLAVHAPRASVSTIHHSRSSDCRTTVLVLPAIQVCPLSTRNLSKHPPLNNLAKTAGIPKIQSIFVHVIILQLAASLFASTISADPTASTNTLMAMIVGIATLLTLLKTQGVMMQMSS